MFLSKWGPLRNNFAVIFFFCYLCILNHQFTQKLNLVVEGYYISLTPFTCGLEIFEKPNKWKSILIGEEITTQRLEHKTSLNHLLDRPPTIMQYSKRKKSEVARAQKDESGGSGNHLGGDHS